MEWAGARLRCALTAVRAPGAADAAESVHKEVKFAHRLCLLHVLSQGTNPVYRIFRLLAGVAACMLLTNAYYCHDRACCCCPALASGG